MQLGTIKLSVSTYDAVVMKFEASFCNLITFTNYIKRVL